MILDITGMILLPGNGGEDCPGNGQSGECCCDECDYMLCCFGTDKPSCESCQDQYCPQAKK
jgi:hypothetical protein